MTVQTAPLKIKQVKRIYIYPHKQDQIDVTQFRVFLLSI